MRRLAGTALAIALVAPSASERAEPERPEVALYAAASLREVLEALAPDCEKATRTRLVFNFGGSNDLSRQIEAGDKADLFFSADESSMDRLQAAGLVDSSSRLSPLSNRLVVIGRADTTLVIGSPRDLSNRMIRRIALADPESVPAGKYARAWLEETGQWASISDRVVPALDVRAALWAVAGGGAEVGVVYRTDARISSRVRVLYEVPAGEGPRISYAVAAMRDRPRVEEARRVVAFLAGPAASDVYQRFGFIVVAPPAP